MASNFLIVTAVASILGFLSGLGVGGGSLLLLWLTLVIGTDQATARLINLLFFLPSAVVSCCFRWKQGTLCIKQVLPAAVFGCIGAILGSMTSGILPLDSLKKLFGLLLIGTGIRELLYKSKKQAS